MIYPLRFVDAPLVPRSVSVGVALVDADETSANAVVEAGPSGALDAAQAPAPTKLGVPMLVPGGVIPAAFELGVMLSEPAVPAATPAAVIVPPPVIDPCAAIGTTAMLDTFTGSGTLDAHTSDSGSTWIQSLGNTDSDAYLIDGTVLRRPDFTEIPGAGGEAWAYPTQQPATARYFVEFTVRFKGKLNGPDPLYSFVQLWQAGDGGTGFGFLCSISSQGLTNDLGLAPFGADSITYTTVPMTWYTVRLYVDGADVALCVNDALIATATLDAAPILPIAMDTFNFGQQDNFDIDQFRIVDVTA